MPRIVIEEDESWPTYRFSAAEAADKPQYEVPLEVLQRWGAIATLFEGMQSELASLYGEAEAEKQRTKATKDFWDKLWAEHRDSPLHSPSD